MPRLGSPKPLAAMRVNKDARPDIVPMVTEADDIPDSIAEIARAVAAGKLDLAQNLSVRIAASFSPASPSISPAIKLTCELQVRVFLRDRFTCRYCRRNTVFIPVLRVLSRLYPAELPYQKNWRWSETHPAYWKYAASCDHVVPVARGGTSAIDNLVTSCYMCNSVKQQWLIDELHWQIFPMQNTDWDGLSGLYGALVEAAGAGAELYHRRWMRALQAVSASH